MKKCDICGEGDVTEVIDYIEYWDENFKCHIIKMKVFKCDVCLSKYANAGQVNFNAKQVRDIDKFNQRMRDKIGDMYDE